MRNLILSILVGLLWISVGNTQAFQEETPPLIAYPAVRDASCESHVFWWQCDTKMVLVDSETKAIREFNTSQIAPNSLAWSPDHQILSFGSGNRLLFVNINTFDTQELSYQTGMIEFQQWSPDGERIAFIVYKREAVAIHIIDADTMTTEKVFSGLPIVRGPIQWSPDSQHILFMVDENRDYNSDIYSLCAVCESAPLNLTKHPARDSEPSWSADGSKITFVSDRDGARQVYSMDADGGNVRLLTNEQVSLVGEPWWVLDDEYILYFTLQGLNSVPIVEFHLLNPETGEGQKIFEEEWLDGYDLSPDRTQMSVIYGEGEADRKLCVFNLTAPYTERCFDGSTPIDSSVPAWG